LEFFYDLKGGDPKMKKDEIIGLMKDVGVWDKRNCLAYTLSGGNKRKLSVAIAMCG
jgi:ABC-type multidrug transport system ATPase subunit